MCGIAGIFSPKQKNVDRLRVKSMTDTIAHRGPEGEGFWESSNRSIAFGHRRLSIIDLTDAGAQPMHYLDRYTITYNGEIYNYVEIKETLQKKGYQFYTHCDTEVVLAAYACYGTECLQYFDGMFAFAIWDEKKQILFCARDRFGEKPFYYNYNSSTQELVFASEMKALWAAGITKEMDSTMLLNYLTLGWTQSATNNHETFFKDIHSIPPSHYMICSGGDEVNIRIEAYWDIDKQIAAPASEDEAKERFIQLLTTSVNLRLRSDVPVGSSLSGGLDSSSIVALVSQLLGNSSKQKTFSATFPGFAKDETAYIKEVSRKYDIENYQTSPTAEGFLEDLQQLIYFQEEPFQSASIYAQYKVYELAKQHDVTVILDGQGADEVLGGYTKYYHWYWQELIAGYQIKALQNERHAAIENGQQVPWGVKNYIAGLLPQVAANHLQKQAYRKQVADSNINSDFFHSSTNRHSIYKPAVYNLNDILYFNTMQFGLEELLRYAERNSMAHSREVRLPFLNHELVQFVFSLPSSYKMRKGFTKYILRDCMQGLLPEAIVWRKDKVGFEPPQQQWMQHPMVIDAIHESRKTLVDKQVLNRSVLTSPVKTLAAHEDDNYDWRFLCAAQCL